MVHVLIAGGSFGAILSLKAISNLVPDAEITVVSQSTHAYWVPAGPRLVVKPELVDECVYELQKTVTKYSKNAKVVNGSLSKVDPDTKVASVDTNGEQQQISYDYLVLATGSRTVNEAFKNSATGASVKEKFQSLHTETKAARKIVVIGGGPTGVELCGELAEHYGKDKEIVLYSGDKYPLPQVDTDRRIKTQKRLEDFGVKVVNDVWLDTVEEPDGKAYQLKFKNGTQETTDCYVNTTGVIPNTGYLDPSYLDKTGRAVVDQNLHLKGHSNIYVIGDIVSGGDSTLIDAANVQYPTLTAALKHDIVDSSSDYKPYSKSDKVTIMVPISSQGGIGLVFGWGVPSFMVKMIKAKDFMISKAASYLV